MTIEKFRARMRIYSSYTNWMPYTLDTPYTNAVINI